MPNFHKDIKILIVEDHLGDFILIEEYLKEENSLVRLKRASTFKEAENLLQAEFFDSILLDLSLPDVENTENLVRDMVRLGAKSPVIVLTGFANKEFGVKTLSLGISDYLLKDELDGPSLAKSINYSIERKKVEYQLSESERNYKALFDLSPYPMFVLNKENLDFLSVNEAAIKLYGYSKEEFLEMNIRDLWITRDNTKVESLVEIKKEESFKVNISHKTKDGETLHLEVQSNPVQFEGREARVSILNNVTSNILAEKKLEFSERRFKSLVQEGSDLIMIMDAEGNIQYISPSSNSILGISPEKFVEINFLSRIHPEDIKHFHNVLNPLKSFKKIQLPPYRYKNSENKYIWLETILTNLYDDFAVNGIVLNSRDITEFIKQEKRLVESLQRYDIVAKATSDTITDYNIQNDTMQYNEGIENMFGYCRNNIPKTGKWWNDHIHPGDRKHVREQGKKMYENQDTHLQLEYRFQCADGSYKYILDRSYMVKDEQGKPLRIIGSMQDITDIHNYIETIEKNNRRLKEIAWTQSHVVRAPLARIMGLIDLLESEDEVEDKSQLLEYILKSAKELDQVIRKITNKTEQAKLNPH